MADTPGPGAEAITACEHVYASHHEPGHRVYWVRQCMICNHVDWNDLDEQIDTLRAEAAAGERERLAAALRDFLRRYVVTIVSGTWDNGDGDGVHEGLSSGPLKFPDVLVDTFALMDTPDEDLLADGADPGPRT